MTNDKEMTRLPYKIIFIIAILLLCVLGTAALADKPAPRSIELNITEITIDLADGETFELEPTVSPVGASENYKWWVSDSSVLKVENGVVTCLKIGSATVNAGVHGYSIKASCVVTVVDRRAPERIIVYPSSISTEPGMGVQLECVAMPQSALGDFVYSSSNTNVATVDENGYVSVLNPGHATLTIKSAYAGDVRGEVKLIAEYGERIKSIALSESSIKLEKGESCFLGVSVEPKDGSRALVYTSDDESVATVDQNGKITAVGFGDTAITVTSYRDPSVSAGVPVSVRDSDRPDEVFCSIPEYVLSPGESMALSIELLPSSAVTSYTVTSSREDIVSVSGDTLSAVKRGISTIRVQSVYREDLFVEFTVTVEDGTVALTMPLRRTTVDGIQENLEAIERVKQSALNELDALYAGGAIGQKEYERRMSAVNDAFAMYAFPWTVDKTVRYWKAENSENGAKDFQPGVIYYGLPYTSGENHNRAYDVERALEQNRYIPVEGESYYLLNRNSADYATGYAGNDCSAFVAQALWGYTVYGDIVKTGTLYYDKRLRSFDDPSELKAGDLLVRHSSHVVMFLYWADEAHTQAVFIQQGGSEPAINTVNTVVMELDYYLNNSYRLRRLAEY